MKTSARLSAILLAICLGTIGVFVLSAKAFQQASDKDKEKKKEEGLPLKPSRKVTFTTDEGTWMSLDVSPDGSQIVFDLLGDLYLLPIGGGEATRLTSGMAWDCQPRFSPDGKQVAFISDRSGSDNVWVVNLDGSGAKALTKETDKQLGSPTWDPSGDYILARKWGPYPKMDNYIHQTSLVLYHKDGGAGAELVKGGTVHTGAAFSSDGKFLYYSVRSGGFAYNADIGRYQVHVLNRETGEEKSITSTHGGGLRPIVSPDGRYLVYVSRHDAKTGLKIRDLTTQEEHWLAALSQRDDQEGFLANDVVPGYSFTPDSKSVVFTEGGHIKRVDVAAHQVSTIPFTAKVDLDLAPRVRTEFKIDDGPLTVRQMRWVNESPDGKLAFSAVGKIWAGDVSGGTPHRLTSSGVREYEPVFSPDGRSIAYVSWSDTDGGELWKASVHGGSPQKLSQTPGYYTNPAWSPDGSKILFVAGSASAYLEEEREGPNQLRWVSPDGGESHLIMDVRGRAEAAAFNHDGTRVFFTEGAFAEGSVSAVLQSVRLDGLDKKAHLKLNGEGGSLIPSPDERWVLISNRYDAYLTAFPKTTPDAPPGITLKGGAVPVKRVTKTGGNYVHWSADGKTITWSIANQFGHVRAEDVWKAEKDDAWKPETVTINLQVPRPRPQGSVLLRNARLVTMKGQEVVERGDILIENNRIKEVSASGNAKAPAGVKVIDLRGKTIIPGFVDIHSHMHVAYDVIRDEEWPYAANLAFGVTTTRDPSIESNGVFSAQELVESGELIGPRIYATGTAMTTDAVTIDSYEDAENVIKRYKMAGADSLKQYMQPRRIQHQWIAMAAAKEGLNLTAEGAGDLKADLAMALDGYTGVEHSLPINPIYKDVVELEAQSGTTYTPTLVVSYGAPEGEFYWRQRMNIHDDPKVMRFTPHEEVDRKARRLPLLFDEEYDFTAVAKGAGQIVSRGGHVGLGSHGEQQGIGAQWELWMLQSGMTPWQALWCATMSGAESIGLDKELGSIEPGKLADLVVLNANPLDNIQNTNKIQYVIQNGVIYNGDTLDEVWPTEKKFPPFFWKKTDAELQALPR
jgi:Tol biopolymer transport system component